MIAGIIAAHYVALDNYPAAVMADSPQAFWRLGEASGATAADASGSARNGSIVGTPTYGVAGAAGMGTNTALTFGSSSYVSVTSATWMNVTNAVTLEGWVKFNTAGTLSLFGRSASGSFLMVDYLSTDTLRVYMTGVNGGTPLTAAVSLRNNAWHHVAATWDGSAQKLYVDGSQVATATVTGTISSSGDFRIGRRYDDASTLTHTADEVAFYNTALSAARIAAHYTAGTTP